ncbi:MAG: DUF3187 family protein [Gammaproteobacteria bacterium]
MAFKNPASCNGCRVFLCLLSWLACSTSHAQNPAPFLTRDMNPLVLPYGLPLPAPARLLSRNEQSFTTSLNISNTINVEQRDNENLHVDVETYQLNLIQSWGFDQWMLRMQLPFTAHNGGFLDSWIENYHDFMHLPKDIRPLYPQDDLNIGYSVDGSQLLKLDHTVTDPGDIAVQAAYQAIHETDFALSLWAGLELPTGNSDHLTGSGSVDVSFWLAMDKGFINDRWLYSNLGLLFISDGDILPGQQKHSIVFGNLGMQFQPWEMILLKAQLDMHSAFYDSATKFLDHVIQLTFGGSVLISDRHHIDIAVVEDIRPGTSPDVNFNISWNMFF